MDALLLVLEPFRAKLQRAMQPLVELSRDSDETIALVSDKPGAVINPGH